MSRAPADCQPTPDTAEPPNRANAHRPTHWSRASRLLCRSQHMAAGESRLTRRQVSLQRGQFTGNRFNEGSNQFASCCNENRLN